LIAVGSSFAFADSCVVGAGVCYGILTEESEFAFDCRLFVFLFVLIELLWSGLLLTTNLSKLTKRLFVPSPAVPFILVNWGLFRADYNFLHPNLGRFIHISRASLAI